MQDLIQHLKGWRLGDWRERLILTPESLAQRWPNSYLAVVVLLTAVGLLLSLGFPLAAVALLVDLPDAVSAMHTLTDLPGLLLNLGGMIGAGAMTAFLWQQKIPLPSGQPLEGSDRAPLDELIASLQTDTRLSRPDGVRITKRHQFASVCVPRNGFALFSRRILLLGLPTLQAMTSKQAEAAARRVLCRPNTLKGWVLHAITCQHACLRQYRATYRTQRTIAGRFMASLFSVFVPAYKRWSAPALRWNELDRDTLLNQQLDIDNVLELLAVDAIVHRFLDKIFWPAVMEKAKQDSQPPYPYAELHAMLHERLTQPVIGQWLAEVASEPQPDDVTKPAMAERLANLGSRRLTPPGLESASAADALLKESLCSLIEQMDKKWRHFIQHRWHREYKRHAKNRARLASLRERASTQNIQGRSALMFAKLARHYLLPEEAVPVYRQIAQMNPEDAKVLGRVGRLLLANDCKDGATLLKRAIRLDARAKTDASSTPAPLPDSVHDDGDTGIESATSNVA